MNFPIKKCLNGSILKWAAILTMLADHIAAAGVIHSWNMRLVGRIAFPLFAFLLVEGAVHTRNIKKYLVRLGVFALISEIPFDLAIFGQPFYWGHQNVYWTLFLALGVIALFQKWPVEDGSAFISRQGAFGFAVVILLADLCRTDYGSTGVLVIVLMYLLRERPWLRFLSGYGLLALMSTTELACLPAFLLIALYNGKRGHQPKYFFYGFYPVHLLVLWLLERICV